jgi:16S rRNA (uracil1498-N3)-methyltransferase
VTKLFVPREQWGKTGVAVRGEDARYLTRVLRLGFGDTVTVLDGEGRAFEAVIQSTGADEVNLVLAREVALETEPAVEVSLFQALPKGDKMDLVVRQATELGAARIVPVITERVVVRLDAARASRRQERWQKIAREAARQCGRPVVPVVEPVLSFATALTLLEPGAFGIMPWEGEELVSLRQCLSGRKPEAVSIFIGPEGGFALHEVETARAQGVVTVTLGRRILRTETAGMVTIALLLYALGEIG